MDDFVLVVVDDSVPVTGDNSTGHEYSSFPTNLDFED